MPIQNPGNNTASRSFQKLIQESSSVQLGVDGQKHVQTRGFNSQQVQNFDPNGQLVYNAEGRQAHNIQERFAADGQCIASGKQLAADAHLNGQKTFDTASITGQQGQQPIVKIDRVLHASLPGAQVIRVDLGKGPIELGHFTTERNFVPYKQQAGVLNHPAVLALMKKIYGQTVDSILEPVGKV